MSGVWHSMVIMMMNLISLCRFNGCDLITDRTSFSVKVSICVADVDAFRFNYDRGSNSQDDVS